MSSEAGFLNRVLVIANPVAGGGQAQELVTQLRSSPSQAVLALAATCEGGNPAGWPVLETTKDGSWKVQLEAYVRTRGVHTLVVVGGDGTLMEVASLVHGWRKGLSPLDISLALVPGGRGNDFVRALYGYSREMGEFWGWVKKACETQRLQWRREEMDLGSADGRLFLNMASLGYGGRVVQNAHSRNAFWSKTSLVYQVEGALALAGGGGGTCDVKVEGKSVYQGEFFGAFVGNGKANGSGLYWTRGAQPNDGALDGIVFPKPGVIEMLRVMGAVKSLQAPLGGLPFRHCCFKGAEISFHFDRPVALELDGDYVHDALNHGFKCLSKALSLWVLKK